MLCPVGFAAGRAGASSELMALVRESEISARTSEILGSGKVGTTMCFADRSLPSGFSLDVSDPPFLYLFSQNRAKETCSLQVNTCWVGQSHQGNVCRQDLECVQQAKVLEETELEVVGVYIWGLFKTAGAGSGSQGLGSRGLCSQQYSSKIKLLRSPEALVSLPVIRLTLRRFSYLISNSEGSDPEAAAMEEMKISYG